MKQRFTNASLHIWRQAASRDISTLHMTMSESGYATFTF